MKGGEKIMATRKAKPKSAKPQKCKACGGKGYYDNGEVVCNDCEGKGKV